MDLDLLAINILIKVIVITFHIVCSIQYHYIYYTVPQQPNRSETSSTNALNAISFFKIILRFKNKKHIHRPECRVLFIKLKIYQRDKETDTEYSSKGIFGKERWNVQRLESGL